MQDPADRSPLRHLPDLRAKSPSDQVPGIQVLEMIAVPTGKIHEALWSPDGTILAITTDAGQLALWGFAERRMLLQTTLPSGRTGALAWSADGRFLWDGAPNGTVWRWDRQTEGAHRAFDTLWSGSGPFAVSPVNGMLAMSFDYRVMVCLPAVATPISVFSCPDAPACFAWSPDGQLLAIGCTAVVGDNVERSTLVLWDVRSRRIVQQITTPGQITCCSWIPTGDQLAVGTAEGTISLIDRQRYREVRRLEGGIASYTSLAFTADGQLLISQIAGNHPGVQFWQVETWDAVGRYHFSTPAAAHWQVAVHPQHPVFVIPGTTDHRLCLCAVDALRLAATGDHQDTLRYTNAKVVLLGDSGVGKTCLGLVLSGRRFRTTESTHGRHVWSLDHTIATDVAGGKQLRETLLWDLAGQPGYRLIHQLHLSEISVALVLYDGKSETDPLAGVYHWARALRQAQRLLDPTAPPITSFLIEARSDRGGARVGNERIHQVLEELHFDGTFRTSAKAGWQIAELSEAIHAAIPWDALPTVTSTHLFQQIREFLIRQKMTGQLLSAPDVLYAAFLRESAHADTIDLHEQFTTCLDLMQARGLIRRLSFVRLMLLQPEILDAYASSLITAVRDEPDGLGCILEEHARTGAFAMPPDERIADPGDERLLLIAMVEDLLRHELALREPTHEGQLLVFPTQATRQHTAIPEMPGRYVRFTFEGPVLSVYATLAVRLAHSGLFRKHDLWQDAITFTASAGGICGLALRNDGEGRGELIVFATAAANAETRYHFASYVAAHLQRRALPETVVRHSVIACQQCGLAVTDEIVTKRRELGFAWLSCPVCSTHIILNPDQMVSSPDAQVLEMDTAANQQRDRDAKRFTLLHQREQHHDVFVCYHDPDREEAAALAVRLLDQQVLPWFAAWDLEAGTPWMTALEAQIARVPAAVVCIGRNGIGPWQSLEIAALLDQFVTRQIQVIPVFLQSAEPETHLSPFLNNFQHVDLRTHDTLDFLVSSIRGTHRRGVAG